MFQNKKSKIKKICAITLSYALVSTMIFSISDNTINKVMAASSDKIAFPGAEGGGQFATGGRGGNVVYVTNLNDSGTGSFRDAVGTSNRIVVFKVGGTIELKSDVVVQSNITVAGQTAPGGAGITLKNYKIGLGGTNVILRFISSRPGERGTTADYDAFGGANGSNSIVDHCSIGWANDEQWGLYSNNDNMTVQYSVIGPSNSFSYHSKGIHGFAVMLGRSNISWHHNLIPHNVSRNFRGKVVGTGVVDFTNNVIYNWASQTAYGTLGHVNYLNNTLKMGISTVSGKNYISVGDSGTSPENYSIYLNGNRFLNKDNTDYSTFTSNNWSGITYGSASGKTEANTRSDVAFEMPVNGVDVSTAKNVESSQNSYNHVIEYAGAGISSSQRTDIDQQATYETKTGTGTLTGARPYSEATVEQKATIDKYSMQCGVEFKYPNAVLTGASIDTDGDGMSDEWEKARELNPNSKNGSDGTLESIGDYCGKGYTNIEYYINDLTINAFPTNTVTLSPIVSKPILKVGATLEENGLYMIKNLGSGMYLEVAGAITKNGANVQQWGATGSASHNTWRFVSAGDGYYYLYSQLGDKVTYVLDLTGNKILDGTNIEIYQYNGLNAQKFKFVEISEGKYEIYTKTTEDASCVSVVGDSKSSGANIEQSKYIGSDGQKWILEKVATTPITPQIAGDANGDSKINILDYVMAKRYVFGIISKLPVTDSNAALDLDSNGKIDANDIVILKKILLKSI